MAPSPLIVLTVYPRYSTRHQPLMIASVHLTLRFDPSFAQPSLQHNLAVLGPRPAMVLIPSPIPVIAMTL